MRYQTGFGEAAPLEAVAATPLLDVALATPTNGVAITRAAPRAT